LYVGDPGKDNRERPSKDLNQKYRGENNICNKKKLTASLNQGDERPTRKIRHKKKDVPWSWQRENSKQIKKKVGSKEQE